MVVANVFKHEPFQEAFIDYYHVVRMDTVIRSVQNEKRKPPRHPHLTVNRANVFMIE
jgi:hypothetical protein